VASAEEWDILKDNIDKRVRELLAQGFDVELG